MSKIEYIDPNNWSLHVIDGENECVPGGWIKLPKEADFLAKSSDGLSIWAKGIQFDVNKRGYVKKSNYTFNQEWWINRNNPEILWTRKMKEYLVKRDGKYELVEAYHLDGGIEIPEEADCLTKTNSFLTFWNGDFKSKTVGYLDSWFDAEKYPSNFLSKKEYFDEFCVEILWQRNPSLSDQCAKIKEVHQNNVDSILSERQSQYGCYEDVAKTTQDILKALRIGNYENMPAPHQEALHMIASKMARLVHGDANHLDSWVDIGGYSKLIVNLIEGGK